MQVNATGALYVDGSGFTQPISGTITAELSTTDNNVLDTMVARLSTIDNIVHVDDDGFTLGSDSGTMMMGFAGTQSVDANDACALACDTDGALHIADGGNTITVDGTVTANLGTTDNAVLDAMAASLALLDNSIASGNELQVDVVDALPAGTNAIGKLAPNSGVDIGDVDVTSISAGTNIIGKVGHDITGGADGVKTVSNAGTDEALGGDVDCKKIDIQAQTDNAGLIAVGFTGVDATEATGTGVILYAGDTYSLEMVNLNLIYIDSTVSGEGVRYTYFT